MKSGQVPKSQKYTNISDAASQLIQAYKEMSIKQQQKQQEIISPRYEKTALYMPQSPIEEQSEEENEPDSPTKFNKYIQFEFDEESLEEISELRKAVEKLRLKYMTNLNTAVSPRQLLTNTSITSNTTNTDNIIDMRPSSTSRPDKKSNTQQKPKQMRKNSHTLVHTQIHAPLTQNNNVMNAKIMKTKQSNSSTPKFKPTQFQKTIRTITVTKYNADEIRMQYGKIN